MTDKDLATWLENRLSRWLTIDLWQRPELETLLKTLQNETRLH